MMSVWHFNSFALSKCIKFSFCESSKIRALCTVVTKEKEPSSVEENDAEQQLFIERQEDAEERGRYLEKRRNKSRLYPQHRRKLHEQAPWDSEFVGPYEYLQTVRYNRRLYGRYGESSKVDPRIAWPTENDLLEAKEIESLRCPKTIQQMVEEEKEKIRAKEQALLENDARIAENLSKLAQWKKELRDKLTKKMQTSDEARQKRQRLIEEVRRHVGYEINPRDPRFQEMVEAKEKEEKKAKKEARKKQKQEEMVAKMLKMAEEDKKEREERKQEEPKEAGEKSKKG